MVMVWRRSGDLAVSYTAAHFAWGIVDARLLIMTPIFIGILSVSILLCILPQLDQEAGKIIEEFCEGIGGLLIGFAMSRAVNYGTAAVPTAAASLTRTSHNSTSPPCHSFKSTQRNLTQPRTRPTTIATMAEKDKFKFRLEIQQMMFVSGETGEPSPETTGIIEEMVRGQVVEMVCTTSPLPPFATFLTVK